MMDILALAKEAVGIPGETARERALLKIIEMLTKDPEVARADGKWTPDRPTVGSWWVSYAPNHRVHNPPIEAMRVTHDGYAHSESDPDGGGELTCSSFEGALWLSREGLMDPFAGKVADANRE